LSQHITETEAKLAAFKAKNMGRLPELTQLNMQMRDRTDSEVMENDRQISMMEERKFYLDGQLAQINPNTFSISASGERIMTPDDRLKTLESQYASLLGVYSTNHPDVVKARREIEALKKETGGSGDSQEKLKRLISMRGELATMREKYSDDHPDVVKLKKGIASLEESQKTSADSKAVSSVAKKPENPAYITLQAQLDSTVGELKTLRAKRVELKAKMASYESMLQQTPQVEREYLDLSRDHENSVHRYQELKAKEMEAQVAQELEKGSKGERFSLIDPPQLPEKPASPNRPAIVLLGLILSIGGGVGYAGILESMDASVRGSKALVGLVQVPLLGIIPYMENDEDRKRKQKGNKVLLFSIVGGIGVLLLLIHFFWLPLDVVWYKAMRILEGYTPELDKRKAG
jgi:succinoglycan biosynthesis transport protein ExoP